MRVGLPRLPGRCKKLIMPPILERFSAFLRVCNSDYEASLLSAAAIVTFFGGFPSVDFWQLGSMILKGGL